MSKINTKKLNYIRKSVKINTKTVNDCERSGNE